MRIRYSMSAAATGLAATLLVAPASAQTVTCTFPATCVVQHGLRATVNSVAQLTVSPLNTSLNVVLANFQGTPNVASGPGISVSTNNPWVLTVRSQEDFWSLNAGLSTKPSTDLRLQSAGAPPFAPFDVALSTTAVQIGTGTAGSFPSLPTTFSSTWDWTDGPGAYEITLDFTLAAP